jgi:hypothetical protein
MARKVQKAPKSKLKVIHEGEIASLDDLLGPPPLMENDNRADYEGLKERLQGALNPSNAMENIWVRDILDLQWELLRLRRLRILFLDSASHIGLRRVLSDRLESYKINSLVSGWALRNEDALEETYGLLDKWGLTEQDIDAHTLVASIDTLERFDRMIAQLEARRNSVLREIDRHRDALARRLKDALDREDQTVQLINHQK